MKPLLILLGILSALLIVAQVVMGLLIRSGQATLAKSHFHTGMLMAVVTLVYVALSLVNLLSKRRREAP